MYQHQNLASDIIDLVRKIGKVQGEVPADKDIYAELGVESVNSIEILFALEDKFGVAIDDTQFIKARTLRLLIELVQRAQAA